MYPGDQHPLLNPAGFNSDPAVQLAAEQAQGAAAILGADYVSQRLREAELINTSPWAIADAASGLAAEAAAMGGGSPSAATLEAFAQLQAMINGQAPPPASVESRPASERLTPLPDDYAPDRGPGARIALIVVALVVLVLIVAVVAQLALSGR